jgi:hypothetical protein
MRRVGMTGMDSDRVDQPRHGVSRNRQGWRARLAYVELLLSEADPYLSMGGRGRRLFDLAVEEVRSMVHERPGDRA